MTRRVTSLRFALLKTFAPKDITPRFGRVFRGRASSDGSTHEEGEEMQFNVMGGSLLSEDYFEKVHLLMRTPDGNRLLVLSFKLKPLPFMLLLLLVNLFAHV